MSDEGVTAIFKTAGFDVKDDKLVIKLEIHKHDETLANEFLDQVARAIASHHLQHDAGYCFSFRGKVLDV